MQEQTPWPLTREGLVSVPSANKRASASARRWTWTAGLLGLVLIVSLVTAFLAGRPSMEVGGPSAPLSAAPSSSSQTNVPSADGCLGGTDPVQAILTAQDEAPMSPEGAAAFVATWARWQGQLPHDDVEFQRTGERIWAPSLASSNRVPPAAAAGSTSWVSTELARYRIINVTTSDVVVEAFFSQTVSRGGANTLVQHVGRFTVTDIGGHWHLKAAGAGEQPAEEVLQSLKTNGSPYRKGC